MLKVVAEDELVAAYVCLGREGEGDRVAVVRVLRRREVGRCRGRVCGEAWGWSDGVVRGVNTRTCTAVVLDADAQFSVDQVRRDGYGLFAVDGHWRVFGGAVGGARADAQNVLLVEGHVGEWLGLCALESARGDVRECMRGYCKSNTTRVAVSDAGEGVTKYKRRHVFVG